MSTTSPVALPQLQAEFQEYTKLVFWIIHRRLKAQLDRYDDEQVQEAAAHAWSQFCRCRQRVADVRKAVSLAACSGVSRALRGTRFVTRERGYIDAMDVRGRHAVERLDGMGVTLRHVVDKGAINPGNPVDAIFDATDRAPVESRIGTLPAHLQGIARLLSYGMTRQLVAERRGISLPTLCRRVEEIRLILAA